MDFLIFVTNSLYVLFNLILSILKKKLHANYRSSPPEVLLGKSILKICSKFTGEHPYRSVISVKFLKLHCKFIEIALRYGVFSCKFAVFPEHLFIRTPLEGYFCNLGFPFKMSLVNEKKTSADVFTFTRSFYERKLPF